MIKFVFFFTGSEMSLGKDNKFEFYNIDEYTLKEINKELETTGNDIYNTNGNSTTKSDVINKDDVNNISLIDETKIQIMYGNK